MFLYKTNGRMEKNLKLFSMDVSFAQSSGYIEEMKKMGIRRFLNSVMYDGSRIYNVQNLTECKFLDVLESRQASVGVNRGSRVRNNHIWTYTQQRDALSYFYPKKIVLNL